MELRILVRNVKFDSYLVPFWKFRVRFLSSTADLFGRFEGIARDAPLLFSPLRNAHLPLINDISDCDFEDDNNLKKKRKKKNIILERETQISNRYTPDCARIRYSLSHLRARTRISLLRLNIDKYSNISRSSIYASKEQRALHPSFEVDEDHPRMLYPWYVSCC